MAKTNFEDGNILTRVPGTRVLAAWLNKVFAHRHDGRDLDGSAPLEFSEDTGLVNAVVATMTPAFDELIVGLPFGVRIANTNTDAVTVTVDGLGPHPLHKLGGLPLAAGDIQATQIIQVAWDGTNFQLLSYNSPPVTDAVTLEGQSASMLVPPGMKGEFFMPTAPPGWLPWDTRILLRAQYPGLYAAIGTTYGAGDNITTFQLGEGRGEFFRGWDNGRGVDPDRQFADWQADEYRAHAHSALQFAREGGINMGDAGSGGGAMTNITVSSGNAGGTETRPRNQTVLVCVKY